MGNLATDPGVAAVARSVARKFGLKARLVLPLAVMHPGQALVDEGAVRFNVIDCGRRWGKSLYGLQRKAAEMLMMGKPVGWFAPTYKDLAPIWRDAKAVFRKAIPKGGISEQEKRIQLSNGAALEFWSLEKPDSGRGRKYGRIIIDEAAKVAKLEEAWNETVRPTLTDYAGDAFFASTPKGRNYFWTLYTFGQDEERTEWRSWQMPTVTNPTIPNIESEVESARRELPLRVFQQEYLAEFLEDGGAVFRNLAACEGARAQDRGERSHRYVIGVDWAKVEDFSVMTVIDCTSGGEVCYIDRFNDVEYMVQVDRLVALCERFDPALVVSERTGNIALAEMLRQKEYLSRRDGRMTGMPIWDFDTTNSSKAEAIQALALAFERAQIRIPTDNAVLRNELEAFTAERTESGLIRYSAPDGLHDDCVMSLALTWWAARRMGLEPVLTLDDRVEMELPAHLREGALKEAEGSPLWDQLAAGRYQNMWEARYRARQADEAGMGHSVYELARKPS
jgi:hypothetical protein